MWAREFKQLQLQLAFDSREVCSNSLDACTEATENRIPCCVNHQSSNWTWKESLKFERREEWSRTWFFLHLQSDMKESDMKRSNDLLRARARERERWNGEESNKFSYQSKLSEWIYHNPAFLLPLLLVDDLFSRSNQLITQSTSLDFALCYLFEGYLSSRAANSLSSPNVCGSHERRRFGEFLNFHSFWSSPCLSSVCTVSLLLSFERIVRVHKDNFRVHLLKCFVQRFLMK